MNAHQHINKYLDRLSGLLKCISTAEVVAFIDVLQSARESGKQVFFIGNGGSAATAAHFVNDLTTLGFACQSLDSVPTMTAIANDAGYENVFVDQLRAKGRLGDVLVALSASGNSPNVIKAIVFANAFGIQTVGLTGFSGGALRDLAKTNVYIPTATGEYGPVEDIHMILDHIVMTYFKGIAKMT